jgi:hypothetical protein
VRQAAPAKDCKHFCHSGKRGFGIEKAGFDGIGEFWIIFGASIEAG